MRSTSSAHKMTRTNDFRVLGVLASAALILLLASGAALAANQIDCSNDPGTLCFGTPRNDEIKGTNGRDEIRAREVATRYVHAAATTWSTASAEPTV